MNEFECPRCNCVNEAYTEGYGSDLIVDFSECEECGHVLTRKEELDIYTEIGKDQIGGMIDAAMDMRKEK